MDYPRLKSVQRALTHLRKLYYRPSCPTCGVTPTIYTSRRAQFLAAAREYRKGA